MKKILLLSAVFLTIACNTTNTESGSISDYPTESISNPTYYFSVIIYDVPEKIFPVDGKSIKWETNISTSDILQSHDSITEDMSYQYLDMMENDIRKTNIKARMADMQIQVTHRQLFKFKDYKNASISRRKILDGDYSELSSEPIIIGQTKSVPLSN